MNVTWIFLVEAFFYIVSCWANDKIQADGACERGGKEKNLIIIKSQIAFRKCIYSLNR